MAHSPKGRKRPPKTKLAAAPKTDKGEPGASVTHYCPTCGRNLDRMRLSHKRLAKLQAELDELRAKIEGKGPEHAKQDKWGRRAARFERRLLAHAAAEAAADD